MEVDCRTLEDAIAKGVHRGMYGDSSSLSLPATDLRQCSDDEVWDQLHSGKVDSDLYKQCILTLQLRNLERQTKASTSLASATDRLAEATSRLALGTWFLVAFSAALFLFTGVQAAKALDWF